MEDRKKKIVAFMKEEAYKPLLFDELVTVLDVPKSDIGEFTKVLDELLDEGKIIKTRKNRYGAPERMDLLVGRIQGNERGYGFLVLDDEEATDIFIPQEGMNGAMHGDRVFARISVKAIGDRRAEGEVVRIISRANETIVGYFESSRNFGFVVPDNKKISGDIFIAKEDTSGAKQGDKVVAQIITWPDKRRNAEGKIIEVLGNKKDVGVDILSIIRAHNFKEEFPDEVVSQADKIPDTVTEDMLKDRRDLRNLKMVTIDGEDAKDLDDAVSVERLPNGLYRLGVHIADVSYYVTEGSPLDREALKRGTSVYLVDRVLPMLPRKLSNGICSLNPQVDRLAFSVFMDIDKDGRVVNHEIFKSVIKTSERMTYTNVYKILVDNDKDLIERYDYLVDDFKTMEELALILRKKRFERGSIDFDFVETKVILDEKGRPVQIKPYEITIANKIIEEFMLICNETVAEHFFWANVPFVYRVHEDPDPDKIQSFNEFIHSMGYSLKGIRKIHPKALQDLLDKVKNTPHERIISTVMLRSLRKARYHYENLGHFGLAAKFYTHFTSPIRRYPDLQIHRIMSEFLSGRLTQEKQEKLADALDDITRLCSERERASDEAERETVDLKKVEYMIQHEGETFEGIISSVTSFGMFVELENTVEGLVRLSSLEDDYYIFNEKTYSLVGERTRRTYKIGDKVQVLVARADVMSRQIDFMLVDSEDAEGTGTMNRVNPDEAHAMVKKRRPRRGDGVPHEVKAHVKGKRKTSKRKK
jgi:ribonuclease R